MKNHLTLLGLDVSSHFVSGLGDCSYEVGKNKNERPSGVLGGLGVIFG